MEKPGDRREAVETGISTLRCPGTKAADREEHPKHDERGFRAPSRCPGLSDRALSPMIL